MLNPSDDLVGYIVNETAEAIGIESHFYSVWSHYNSGNTTQILVPLDGNQSTYIRVIRPSESYDNKYQLITNADFARGFQSAVNVPANGYADREVSHGLSGTPVSAIATLKVNTTSSSNMANVQIQVNEITSSIIKVRIHNNTSNEATVNFYWAAFL